MDREIDSHKEKKLQISEKQRLLITAYRVSGLNRKATGFDSCTSNNGQRIETEQSIESLCSKVPSHPKQLWMRAL